MRPLRLALMVLLVVAGCQPAERYGARPAAEPATNRPGGAEPAKQADAEPPDPEIQWIDVYESPKPDVPIEFVHADRAPDEWKQLRRFWNAPPLTRPDAAAKLLGMPPLTAGVVAGGGGGAVKVRVPLGLPDPRDRVPADNPLTLGKWQLGRRLFFDDSWLGEKRGTSCATCHQPRHGFADDERTHGDFNAPTLLNCVFNREPFWDGRARRLEEVVQRTLEDERGGSSPRPFRHVWGGVIGRLRERPDYHEAFNNVFGKPPREKNGVEQANITQNTVGRALACYLRTLLAGDSLHDRAAREQHARRADELKAEHYETVLDDAALSALERGKAKKADVAAELLTGYRLFTGKAGCRQCHPAEGTFRDDGFHNLGVGYPSKPGHEGGRFAQVPVGGKDRYLIDAYRTPTLRGLSRSGPYFHDGSKRTLREVVEFYNTGAAANDHLDPALRRPDGRTRVLNLTPAEVDALVLFLRALDGGDVPAELLPK